MNKRFCLTTIHHILQDEIEVFAMYPLPSTTQRTCHHLYEVNTSATREISNYHPILLCARRWIKVDDVNLSITWWMNFNRWQNNTLAPNHHELNRPNLHWPHGQDKWPINTILPSTSSNNESNHLQKTITCDKLV